MASSSSSSSSIDDVYSQSPKKYEIFISFRGDTRNNFTRHLHDALSRSKIETYVDYRIEKGDELWPALEKAIENSSLFLIIFSEQYASSSWCLDELDKIVLECAGDQKQRVLPVFYKIEPAHVRKQAGNYEKALLDHENSPQKQQHVPRWRDALIKASLLAGWHCNPDKDEVELIRDIVNCVLTKLNRTYQSDYSDGLIGIHEQIANIELLLQSEVQDIVQFIGIWGMGGIGKTTLAAALFKKLYNAFESSCFLANVREESEKNCGVTHLKDKLLSTLLEDNDLRKGMPNGETAYDIMRLKRKKVLVVLDDVNDPEHLEILVGRHNWFGKGSRIIITTRDMQVLGKHIDEIYKVKPLWIGDALRLFNSKAFKNKCSNEEFNELSRKVIDYADGNPLILIVLGSLLYNRDKEQWNSQLEKLEKMPCTKIHKILKLSYDGLDVEEKNIFLDIACFFKGRNVRNVQKLLSACGYSVAIGLKSLQDKVLLTFSNDAISMHDSIQDMGREIVREKSSEDPGQQSRLWNPNDIYKVLKYNQGSEAIKGISLDVSKIERLNLSSQVFAMMHKLKFLELYGYNDEKHGLYFSKGLEYLPSELRYFHWNGYPFKSLPLSFLAENLVRLELQNGEIRELWNGTQNLINLKVIDLSSCKYLFEIPDFSKALNLEQVYLFNCVSLCNVHPSVLYSDKLEILDLSYCVALTSLKSDIHLKSLCRLSLFGCSSLKEFSVTSKNMIDLELNGTAINDLSSFAGQQFKLEFFHLSECKRLTDLPNSLSQLSSLISLSLTGSSVERLPAGFKHLRSLKYLWLNNCKQLENLPELPPSILALDANDCSSLETVPFTSTAAQPVKEKAMFMNFCNCKELDGPSVEAILANVLLHINRHALDIANSEWYVNTQVTFPGWRIPQWFKYRTDTQASSITIDLSSAPLSVGWALLFCFIAPRTRLYEYISIQYEGCLQIIENPRVVEGDDYANNEEDANILKLRSSYWESVSGGLRNLKCNHICVWCDGHFSSQIYQRIKDCRATSTSEISLKLNFHCYIKHDEFLNNYKEVTELGVCPTYASEYQDFIKEMELKSHAIAKKSKDLILSNPTPLRPELKRKLPQSASTTTKKI